MVEPGQVLAGKYRVERVLGRGGIGVVLLAHHLGLDEPVAIKMLLPEMLGRGDVDQRFLREAQAAVKLKNEHVCRVTDVGTLDTGEPYMVMEYMEGSDLSELLKQHGKLDPGTAVDFMLQACMALADAHALGIVHRDIKPSNFFVTRRGDGTPLLKVLDFGISKMPAGGVSELTQTQTILGTPAYMSPEQVRASKHVDARTDIWALGVVLYQVLAGQVPFRAEVFSELVIKVVTEPPPLPQVPFPGGLGGVIARCLEKDPARRFASVAELAAALAPYATAPQRAAQMVERIARTLGMAEMPPIAHAGQAGHLGYAATAPGYGPPAGQEYGPGPGGARPATGQADGPHYITGQASGPSYATGPGGQGHITGHGHYAGPGYGGGPGTGPISSPGTSPGTSPGSVTLSTGSGQLAGPAAGASSGRRRWLIGAASALVAAGAAVLVLVLTGGDGAGQPAAGGTPEALDAGAQVPAEDGEPDPAAGGGGQVATPGEGGDAARGARAARDAGAAGGADGAVAGAGGDAGDGDGTTAAAGRDRDGDAAGDGDAADRAAQGAERSSRRSSSRRTSRRDRRSGRTGSATGKDKPDDGDPLDLDSRH